MMNELLPGEHGPVPAENQSSTANNMTTQGGDFVGHDKVIRGDQVHGNKLTGSEINVSPGAQVNIYQNAPREAVPDTSETPPDPGDPPYKGLYCFNVNDTDLFFGREKLTAELVANLNHNRFLAVIGASGSGKSSLVRAGLISALQKGKPLEDDVVPPSGSEHWQIVVITPGTDPLESLAAKLTQNSESVTATATLIDDLSGDPRNLHLYVRRLIESDNRLLLVIDQFEEIFTLCSDLKKRRAFIDNLLYAANDNGVTTVVIVLRADFYSDCAGYDNLRHALERNQKYIGAMDRKELQRAIEEPAQRTGWSFEVGLVDDLLRDVGASEAQKPEPGALPLLSHALLETWQRRRGRTMTLQGYKESGGVQGAIAKTAETVYRQRLTSEQQSIARNVFLRLTELGEGTQDSRRRAKLDELIPKGEDPSIVTAVLKILADAHLIVTDAHLEATDANPITANEKEVEVAHEALIREWPTLHKWLAQNRDDLRTHQRLTRAADEWITRNRDPALLYRGTLLAQASEWATKHQNELNKQEDEFLSASQHESAMAVRSQRRRRYVLTGAIAIASILATAVIIIGVVSLRQSKEIRSRQLAGDAREKLDADPELSIMLARAALGETYTAEGEEALRNALQRSRIMQTTTLSDTKPAYVAFSPGHQRFATSDENGEVLVRSLPTGEVINKWQVGRWVTWLAFSPLSGRLLAGADVSGTVNIWDVMANYEVATLEVDPNKDVLTSVAFSPDEQRLATSGYDGKLRLWDLATQKTLAEQDISTAESMAFSPDGKFLVTASYYGEISVLDAASLVTVTTWTGHQGGILDIAFHPDGKMFATVGEDSKVRVWDIPHPDDGLPRYELEGHGNTILDVAYNTRGNCLATVSYDHTTIVWDDTGRNTIDKLVTLSAGDHVPLGVEFADAVLTSTHPLLEPCGTQLRTVDMDGTLQTWNIGPSAEYRTFTDHANRVEAVNLAPDGQTLATVDDDGMIFIRYGFAQPPVRLPIHSDQIREVVFSPDGQKVATASWDGTAKVLDLDRRITDTLTITVQDESGESVQLYSVAFRPPDGKQILTGGSDGVARLWDTASGELVKKWPLDPAYGIYSIAFNKDGSQFVTGGRDGIVYVWDINQDREVHKFDNGSFAAVPVAVFNPDGKSVVTGDENGDLGFWSLDSAISQTISAYQGPINAIEFSPDGTLFATAGSDRRATIWNNTTREHVSILQGNLDQVTDVKFMDGKDGLLLITTGWDNSVRLYLVRADDLARFAAARVVRSLTPLECNRYFDSNACPP